MFEPGAGKSVKILSATETEFVRGLGLFDWLGNLHCFGGHGAQNRQSWLAAGGLGVCRSSHDYSGAFLRRACFHDAPCGRYVRLLARDLFSTSRIPLWLDALPGDSN